MYLGYVIINPFIKRYSSISATIIAALITTCLGYAARYGLLMYSDNKIDLLHIRKYPYLGFCYLFYFNLIRLSFKHLLTLKSHEPLVMKIADILNPSSTPSVVPGPVSTPAPVPTVTPVEVNQGVVEGDTLRFPSVKFNAISVDVYTNKAGI